MSIHRSFTGMVAAATIALSQVPEIKQVNAEPIRAISLNSGWETSVNVNWKDFWRQTGKSKLFLDVRWEGEREGVIPEGIDEILRAELKEDEMTGKLALLLNGVHPISSEQLKELAGERTIAIFCKANGRAGDAEKFLKENLKITNSIIRLDGGMDSDPANIENRQDQTGENNGEVTTRVAARN